MLKTITIGDNTMIERDITLKEEDKRFLEAAEQFYTDARELYEKDAEEKKNR